MSEKPVAVVTGASSGIGACFAEQLAGRGYDLIIVARRRERLEQLSREIQNEHGVAVEIMTVDLSNQESAREFAGYLSELDRVDMLVNSAGFGTNGAFAQVDPKRIEQELNVDLVALFMLTRAVLPGMLARSKGDVINVSSVGGLNPAPYFSTYSAVKSGVIAFTQSLFGELKDSGVRVQVLCPGPVPTEFNKVANVDGTQVPGFLIQSAQDCVAGSLRDLDRGIAVSIPHTFCRWIFGFLRHLPLSLRLSVVSGVVPEEATTKAP